MNLKSKKTLDTIDADLERAIPIVAAGYASRFGIQVTIGGDDAYTNGEIINLPLLKSTNKGKLKIKVYWGYLAHEAAHCRYTDFTVGKPAGVLGFTLNIVEDVRIESLFEDDFPGSKKDLEAVMDDAANEGCFIPKPSANPVSILMGYLIVRLNAQYLNRKACIDALKENEELARQVLPKGFFIRLDTLLKKYMLPTSTKDCLKLSELILSALQEAEKEEQQPKQNTSGDSSQSESSTDNESKGKSKQGESKQDESKQGGGNSGSILDTFDEKDAPALPSEIAKESIEKNADKKMKTVKKPIAGLNTELLIDQSQIDGFVQSSLARSSSLRHRLLSLVQARDRTRRFLAQSGKKAQSSRLASVATGNTRVFRQTEIKKSPNSAVHLLLDNSGSMNGHKQLIANQATAAISIALNSLPGTSIAVSAFPGIKGHVSPIIGRGTNLNQTIGNCNIVSHGGTPLAEAQLYCLTELSRCKEDRKIFFVITDGDANNKPAVKHLNSYSDVLSLGLIIGSNDTLKGMFDYTATISDINELQQKVFELIEQVI